MVRCGSCGHAFNALAYLSEQMPKQPRAHQLSASLPELKPEIIDTDDGLPKSISAEQSAALLKTLDELAGSNIRIEDTGFEWRVLDEEDAAAAADDVDAGHNIGSGITSVDEYLDDTETPIDEFLTATPEVVDAPEIFAAAAIGAAKAPVDELRFDDNTPLPDDFDLEAAASCVSNPEPAPQQSAADDFDDDADVSADFALSEPDEWTDILGEFQDLAPDLSTPIDVPAAADTNDSSNDVPLDMDTQFALQAEAMGINLSGIDEIEAAEALDGEHERDDNLDATLEGSIEDALDDDFGPGFTAATDDKPDLVLEDALDFEPEVDLDDEQDDVPFKPYDSRDAEFDREIEQLDLIDEPSEFIEEPIVARHEIENELAVTEEADESEASADSYYLPPMTAEEHTVNMMIDQDLMSFAVEDEDGFASTIVMGDKKAGKKTRADGPLDTEFEFGDDDSEVVEQPGFETIIMEGEFVRSAFDTKKLKADAAAMAKLAKIGRANEVEEKQPAGKTHWGMAAGVAVLALALMVQGVHQSRETLATLPVFSNTIGQVYRLLGKPVQPAWDITGWRFEATKGNADGEQGDLTIYSRLGNKSDGPLPYPLIGISLTDRFEETIGSRVLDPAEYLPTDLDPRKLVPPGNTFNAVITVDSATENATGFKLNVCYRLSDGQLRCAIDDFK